MRSFIQSIDGELKNSRYTFPAGKMAIDISRAMISAEGAVTAELPGNAEQFRSTDEAVVS